MRVLLLSGYDAPSHRRWREQLAAHFPDWRWTQLALPPRHFKWRMRGSGFLWAHQERERLLEPYDLLIATSMVDLSCLRGFVPELCRIPTLVYFHENQFAYPQSKQQRANVEPQLINLYTALCADQVAFNSDYNRTSFLAGATRLLKRLPDAVPEAVMSDLEARCRVLPVPIEAPCFVANDADPDGPLTLVWNHRWEYDKGPDRLLLGLQRFFEQQPEARIRLHVVGQQFRQHPPAFTELKTLLEAHNALGHWGYEPSRERYRALLAQSHCVLSNALHDFQGLSILEATAAGCRPLLPDREAYPEWFPRECRYTSDRDNPLNEANAFAALLHKEYAAFTAGQVPRAPSVEFLHEGCWQQPYTEVLTGVAHAVKL